jgi:hypothetical protein
MSNEESALPNTIPHELEPPAETQIAPVDSNVGEEKVPDQKVSAVRRCKQITSSTKDELKLILSELWAGIENPFYKYSEKNGLSYINSNVRKRAKKNGSVFEEDKRKPRHEREDRVEEEVPPPTSDIDPVPSVAEVDKVEMEVKHPIRQRKLDLLATVRQNDLIDQGFVCEQGPRTLNFKDQGEPLELARVV